MKSVNYALRSFYKTAFTGLTVNSIAVPTYYLDAPESETSQIYITLNTVSNVDISTKQSADTNTSMQVQIHTWSDNGNAGKNADDVASAVYSLIYPNPDSTINLDAAGFQAVSISVGNDLVNDHSGRGVRQYLTRIITFNHNIYHK